MINRAENISIDLRSLDGNLKGESEKEDGVLLLTSARRLEEALNAHHRRKRMWNSFFVLACCFAVFVDPLLCYVGYDDGNTDDHVFLVYGYLRPIVDVIYIIDIIISLLEIICKKCKNNACKPFGACCSRRTKSEVRAPPEKKQSIKTSLYKILPLVPRILVTLPTVEIIVFSWYLDGYDNWNPELSLCIIIPIQYTLRIYDIYTSLRRRLVMKTGVVRWLKPILDFLPFILASHLIGGIWFLIYSKKSDWKDTHFIRNVSRSFWWALRNLSSFGSNLSTDSSTSEIYFQILISISGMVLFLIYLNARVQEAQESLKKLKKKQKKQLMIPDVDLWLSKNDLPKDLKIYEKKDLKTVIMDNIHKLEKKEVINVQSILSVLPIHDKKRIIYRLCIASLKKVPLLETINEKVLKGIADHLKPVSYTEDKYIVQEGKPLRKMLFITQGIAWTYTANGTAGTLCDSKWLKRGSFCGEEILDWAFKSPLLSDIPISTRTVIPEEQVEGFVIMASDLKSVVSKFWWHFCMKVTSVSQLEQWEHLAASSIQAAWRRHAKARDPSNWDKVFNRPK